MTLLGDSLTDARSALEDGGFTVARDSATRDEVPLLRARMKAVLLELEGDPVTRVSVMVPVGPDSGKVVAAFTGTLLEEADAAVVRAWMQRTLAGWSRVLETGTYLPLDVTLRAGACTVGVRSMLPLLVITYER